jgi:hypothetical protein
VCQKKVLAEGNVVVNHVSPTWFSATASTGVALKAIPILKLALARYEIRFA